VNATAFGSRVARPVQARALADGTGRLALANAPAPTRTWGGELLARLVRPLGAGDEAPALRVTATYTFLRATECDPDRAGAPGGAACARREVPLTPRHAAGVVASAEREGRGRVGVELYYTGRQALERDPYRRASRPYAVVGLLAERAVGTPLGPARLFVNAENLGGVRQTRTAPLVLPARGAGGRWTTDVWAPLEGRTVNAGVRLGR
jgi:iron complex outermembrane receptor protein